nr:hypothetical protein GCM10020092_093510 [Actinoplanes digitatis]
MRMAISGKCQPRNGAPGGSPRIAFRQPPAPREILLSQTRAVSRVRVPLPAKSGSAAGAVTGELAVPEPPVTDLVPAIRPGDGLSAGPHPVELAGLLHELSVRILGADAVPQALDRLAAFVAERGSGRAALLRGADRRGRPAHAGRLRRQGEGP